MHRMPEIECSVLQGLPAIMAALVLLASSGMLWCCSLMSVLEDERKEFEAACEKHEREKQALMAKVQARRATVRGILEAAVLPSAESPAR